MDINPEQIPSLVYKIGLKRLDESARVSLWQPAITQEDIEMLQREHGLTVQENHRENMKNLPIPDYFCDSINSLGTEFSPMEAMRLVLGLAPFYTVYTVAKCCSPPDTNEAEKVEEQTVRSALNQLPEYYVNAFLQICYACQNVKKGPIDDSAKTFLLTKQVVLFSDAEGVRKLVDMLK